MQDTRLTLTRPIAPHPRPPSPAAKSPQCIPQHILHASTGVGHCLPQMLPVRPLQRYRPLTFLTHRPPFPPAHTLTNAPAMPAPADRCLSRPGCWSVCVSAGPQPNPPTNALNPHPGCSAGGGGRGRWLVRVWEQQGTHQCIKSLPGCIGLGAGGRGLLVGVWKHPYIPYTHKHTRI